MADGKFADLAEFAIPFASATIKLKRAMDAGEGVALDPAEVKATVDALKMLRQEGDHA